MKFDRRDFLGLSVAGGALALAGPLARSARAARDKELNILCWEGYNSDEVLDPFRRQTSAKVSAESGTSDPFRAWREWFQENEQRWSEAMTEILGDDRFAKGMGRYFQEAMHTHRIFTDSTSKNALQNSSNTHFRCPRWVCLSITRPST